MSTLALKLEDLKSVDLFADLEDEDADCEVEGEMLTFEEGEMLFSEGDEAKYFYVFLEGVAQVYRMVRGQRVFVSNFYAGMTGGELPMLSGTVHLGNGVALTRLKVFLVSEKNFWLMMGECETVRRKILSNMAERNRNFQTVSFQREKLISLGTLAAGLAHELNNPASAAHNAAINLVRTLQDFDDHSSSMLKEVMFQPEFQNQEGNPFAAIYAVMNLAGIKLNPLEQSEKEDALIDWLESQSVENAWEIAPTLVSVGFDRDNLAAFSQRLVPRYLSSFLQWLHKDVEMRLLARDLELSTERMTGLLGAVKSYSYMDQEVQWQRINVQEGLDNTLVVLQHKLNAKRVQVVREYAANLPAIMAFGGELNQVWTNLIDNAADAVAEGGQITIRTYPDPDVVDRILVEIEDNGVGVPPEIQDKIFDPFFTTKGIGKGTGIGLEIAYRIVVSQHKGSISVKSRPGYTSFQICLPIGETNETIQTERLVRRSH